MHDAATTGMLLSAAADDAEAALRALPGVLDACVLTRRTTAGTVERVGYVTVRDGASVPPIEGLGGVVRLSRMPRGADGTVDRAALEHVPVWDEALSAGWQARLAATPGIADAAVVREESGRSRPRLHLADLLPGHRADAGGDAAAESPAVSGPRAAQRPAIGAPLSDRPALSHGPAPVEPPGFPATLAAALERAAGTAGAHLVHVADDFSETVESYGALRDRAVGILGGLQRLGLTPGMPVIIDASDSSALFGAFWATVLGGMVPVPMVLHTPGGAGMERLRAVWDLLDRPPVVAGAAAVAALAPRLPAHGLETLPLHGADTLAGGAPGVPSPAADPDEPALILLTSGSTGVPKGVVGSHRSLLSMAAAVTQLQGFGPEDTSLNWMPLDHVGGIVFFGLLPTATGASQVHVRPDPVLREPLRWLDLVDRHRASIGWAPNFAYGLIAQAVAAAKDRAWDLSSMRFLINAGEAVSNAVMVEFFERLNRHGLRPGAIHPCFGMTETASAITTAPWHPPQAPQPFIDLGPPVPGAAIRITDEAGAVLREGEIGQLELSGTQIFRGYHGRPDLTAEAFRDGWYRSGDLAYIADGRLFITGRDKDVIIVNGANFYSHEIETAVSALPGLDRTCTAAVGVRPADAATDRVALFFHAPEHAQDGRALAALVRTIRRRMARELGVAVDFLVPITPDRVPRTSIGKIRRPLLKTAFENGAFDDEVRRIERLTGGPSTLPDWFHERRWVPLPAPIPRRDGDGGGTVLAFTGGGAAAALRAAAADAEWIEVTAGGGFAATGPASWTIAPEDPGQYSALFAALAGRGIRQPLRILHLWSHDGTAAGAGPLLRLGQALQALPARLAPVELTVVAFSSLPAAPDESPDPERAALPGLTAALAAELPGVACRLIDLPPDAAPDTLVQEWLAPPSEPEIARRGDRRLAARFAPVDARGAARPLPRGGTVLLTGGLGGVGQHVARHLLTRHGVRLLLTGRTAEGNLSPERAGALAALRHLGEVAYAAADATDAAAMAAAADAARTRWGRPLDAVIHLAGEGHPLPLADETPERLAAAVQARTAAVAVLAGLSAVRPDAPVLIAGTVAAALGGATMASYAAAGSAQAAVAAGLAARSGGRVRFAAFSSWRDTGMSRGVTTPDRLRAAGLHVMEPAAGLASVEAALGLPGGWLLIGIDGDHPRHSPRVLGTAEPLETPAAYVAGPAAWDGTARLEDRFGTAFTAPVTALDSLPRTAGGALDRQRLHGVGATGPAEAPRDHTERRLARLWEAVLGTAVPGRHDDFFALGGNSLRAAQVAARVRDTFRIDLPVMAVLAKPTIAGVAEALRAAEPRPGFAETLARRLDEIERMTPEQVAALRARAGAAP